MKLTTKNLLNVRITKYLLLQAFVLACLLLLLAACGDNPSSSLAQPPTITPTSTFILLASKTTPTIQQTTQSTATQNESANTVIVKKETAIAEATLTGIAQPTNTPVPTLAVGTPFCKAQDLSVTDGLQGATGSLAGSIVFTNKGSSSCYLQGYPQIQIQNGDGKILLLQYGAFCVTCTDPNITDQQRQATVTAIGQEKITLQPGKQAFVMIFWSNWCGKDKLNSLQFVVTLQKNTEPLVVPMYSAGGQTPLTMAPRCDAPDNRSTLNIGSYEYRES